MLSALLIRLSPGIVLRLPFAVQLAESSHFILRFPSALHSVFRSETLEKIVISLASKHMNTVGVFRFSYPGKADLTLQQKKNNPTPGLEETQQIQSRVHNTLALINSLLGGGNSSMLPRQPYGSLPWMQNYMNSLQQPMMQQSQQFPQFQQMPQLMQFLGPRHPVSQFPPNMGYHQGNVQRFSGSAPRMPARRQGGNNHYNSQQGNRQQQQQYPRNNDRNRLKRKSSDFDDVHDVTGKMGRFQEAEPHNSSRSSFNTSSSTAMHMKLVNGAKPILHIPGQPCERITEAIVQYYNDFHQSEDDLKHKIVLSNCLYAIVRDIFPGCRLFIVGSSLSGFGTHTSDMDLCLLVTQVQDIDQKFEAVHILTAIHRSLQSCTFIKSSQVIKAKVPILKFTDSMKNIECDLNINNGVGIRNTHLLKYYCLADTRVAPLMLFIKFWARFHDINDAHKRTISSYSLALMLIHYLQVCKPPVLPCLQRLYPEKFEASVDLRKLRLDEPLNDDLISKNTSSLGKLFQGFLDYYAYNFRPEFDVISIREGQVIPKHMVQRNSRDPAQWKCLCVEEPFDQSNTARSVFDPLTFQRVRQVFKRSADTLKREGDVSAILRQPF